jgi:hypothetical protein
MDKSSGKLEAEQNQWCVKNKKSTEDGALKRRDASSGGLEVWLYVIKVLL